MKVSHTTSATLYHLLVGLESDLFWNGPRIPSRYSDYHRRDRLNGYHCHHTTINRPLTLNTWDLFSNFNRIHRIKYTLDVTRSSRVIVSMNLHHHQTHKDSNIS